MGFLLKPGLLEKATSAADIQKLMKSDLKNNVGKQGVKFIAAKNCVIGGKTVHLFIVTDNATPFEAIIKTQHPKAYRAKGTCDLEKGDKGATQVTIKTCAGQMLPDAVAKLLPEVVAHDSSFVAHYTPPTITLPAKPTLKETPKIDRGGVPQWAKEAFGNEPRSFPVMVSMDSDGNIGSVYFDGNGRIRTTHVSGPTEALHSGTTTTRFNISQSEAEEEFLKRFTPGSDLIRLIQLGEKGDKQAARESNKLIKAAFREWLKQTLAAATLHNTPDWAKPVDGPDTAHDFDREGEPDEDTQLVEIFKKLDGGSVRSHISRGTATKIHMNDQTLHVLREAISYIDRVGPDGKKVVTDPHERNVEFYNFLDARLPDDSEFMDSIRRPDEI